MASNKIDVRNTIFYNGKEYQQKVTMNNGKKSPLLKVSLLNKSIAQLIEKDSSYSFEFDRENLSFLNFDNNFKGSEIEKIIKESNLEISLKSKAPFSFKQKDGKQLVFSLKVPENEKNKELKIIIDAVSITLQYDSKTYVADITQIDKENLSVKKQDEVLSLNVNTKLYEKLLPNKIENLNSINMPLYMLRQYVALLEPNNITNENQSIDAKNINDKLKVFKYSFTPENKENYFAFIKNNNATQILFSKQLETISNCRLYYSLNGNNKEYFLIISTNKNENIRLNLPKENQETFLNNFSNNIQTAR